jgi:biotin carboxyl carrier protein
MRAILLPQETLVAAPVAGLIRGVYVVTGDSLAAGDLLLIIEKAAAAT